MASSIATSSPPPAAAAGTLSIDVPPPAAAGAAAASAAAAAASPQPRVAPDELWHSLNCEWASAIARMTLRESTFTLPSGTTRTDAESVLKQTIHPNEVAVHARLPPHAHILPATAVTQDTLLVPIMWGGDLFAAVASDAWVPSTHAWPLWCQVVLAVQHAHAHGVFHLDIKLDNVLLSHKIQAGVALPTAKLCDFGACLYSVTGAEVLQHRRGTLMYQAPEMAWLADGFAVDLDRADAWMLGILLLQMTTRHSLMTASIVQKEWPAMTAAEVQEQIDAMLALVWKACSVPPRVHKLLLLLLRAEPAERPSVSQLAAACC